MGSLSRFLLVGLVLSAFVSCNNKSAPTQPGMPPTPTQPGAHATPTPTPVSGGMATVNVGQGGGLVFVDTRSGTNVTTIHAGQPVQWVWVSGTHSTTSGACCSSNGQWDSGVKSSGNFSHTFSTTGNFPYFCTVHGSLMTGSVVVNP